MECECCGHPRQQFVCMKCIRQVRDSCWCRLGPMEDEISRLERELASLQIAHSKAQSLPFRISRLQQSVNDKRMAIDEKKADLKKRRARLFGRVKELHQRQREVRSNCEPVFGSAAGASAFSIPYCSGIVSASASSSSSAGSLSSVSPTSPTSRTSSSPPFLTSRNSLPELTAGDSLSAPDSPAANGLIRRSSEASALEQIEMLGRRITIVHDHFTSPALRSSPAPDVQLSAASDAFDGSLPTKERLRNKQEMLADALSKLYSQLEEDVALIAALPIISRGDYVLADVYTCVDFFVRRYGLQIPFALQHGGPLGPCVLSASQEPISMYMSRGAQQQQFRDLMNANVCQMIVWCRGVPRGTVVEDNFAILMKCIFDSKGHALAAIVEESRSRDAEIGRPPSLCELSSFYLASTLPRETELHS